VDTKAEACYKEAEVKAVAHHKEVEAKTAACHEQVEAKAAGHQKMVEAREDVELDSMMALLLRLRSCENGAAVCEVVSEAVQRSHDRPRRNGDRGGYL
jgi:hypothetical protein